MQLPVCHACYIGALGSPAATQAPPLGCQQQPSPQWVWRQRPPWDPCSASGQGGQAACATFSVN